MVEAQRPLHGSYWKSIAGEVIGQPWLLVRNTAPTRMSRASPEKGSTANGGRSVINLQSSCCRSKEKCEEFGNFEERYIPGLLLPSDGMIYIRERSISTFQTHGISWLLGKGGPTSSIVIIFMAGGFLMVGTLICAHCLG